jgi:hypothetical protein
MGLRRAAARLLVLALVVSSAVGVAWTREPATPAHADVVGAPSWWSGDCDTNYWTPKARSLGWTGRAAYRLGASYLGVPACGPRPSVDGSPNVVWRRSGWGEYEWQCVELAQRFMAQIYGVKAYQANGNQVVSHYSTSYGGGLVRINNGIAGQAPQPGDVISFNSSTNSNGHVAVVTANKVDGAGNGSVTTMEENYSSTGWRTLTVKAWRVQPSGNLTPYGWLHDPQGRGNPNATLPSTMNMLSNSSFELGTGAGWVPGTLPTALARTVVVGTAAAPAAEGAKMLDLKATQAGASTWQVVAMPPRAGRAFTFSAWVRSASGPVSGRLVLTALGGTVETEATSFTAGPKWSLVSVPLTVATTGHTGLQAEVAVDTVATPLDVDGTQLADAGVANASFEQSLNGWVGGVSGTSVARGWVQDASYAFEGNAFMRTSTLVAGGSVAQTVVAVPQVGHAYTFSAWLRTMPGSPPVTGSLRLTALGSSWEVGTQTFTVGPQWTLVSVPLAVTRTGHTSFRTEVLLTTTGRALDVDATQLVDDSLANASLEVGTSGASWVPGNAASALTHGVLSSSSFAREGSRYMYLRTTQPGASIRQTPAVAPQAGRTYTFSAWVRSASGTTVSGWINAITLGGTTESGITYFTVGPKWTHISAPLSVTRAGHSGLLTQIGVTSVGRNLYFDATSLVAGDARQSDITTPTLTLKTHPAEKSTSVAATFTAQAVDPDDQPSALTYRCYVDGVQRACGATLALSGLSQGKHTYTVSASDPVGNRTAGLTFPWTVDSIAPAVALRGPASAFTLDPATHVTFSATDAGSGVESYDVRMRVASWNGGYGAWMQPTAWTKIATPSVDQSGLIPGLTYCFSARARDAFGNVSAWTDQRCTSRVLDDRSLHLGTGWVQKVSYGYYFNTLTATGTLNATLTRPSAQLDRVALVATRCPTCGVVGVYVGTTLVGTVNLYSATTERQHVFVLKQFALSSGTVVLKSLSSGKTVQVDGLGITRS